MTGGDSLVVTVATVPMPVSTSVWALFAVAVVGDLALAGLCVPIAHRARRPRPAVTGAGALIDV